MKHVIIGTAGHVDHGKTLLIKALTGIDTDRLKEEKKRGITIELGFAYLDLPNGEKAGIIDVPGHEKFIRNMLAGAGGIDLALLIIAADDGVMPQTREHLGILSLLGIHEGIIVITKCDLAEPDWIEMVREDIKREVADSFLHEAPIVPVSTYTGGGIEELRQIIFQKAELISAKNTNKPFRIPVDRIFSVDGFGTVITGTLIEGVLREGDEVTVYPSGLKTRVRNLQVHSRDVETAWAGQRAAVNLAGLKRDDINRGDTLAAPDSMANSMMLDVKLQVLRNSGRVLENGSRLHFYYGARDLLCKLILLEQDALSPGEEGYAQLRFTENVSLKKGDRFVARFYSPLETVGGGVVLDPNPVKHRRKVKRIIEALKVREKGSAAENLLQAISDASPTFTPLAEIQKHLLLDNESMRSELQQLAERGDVILLGERHAIDSGYRDKLSLEVQDLLNKYHIQNPLQTGMRRDELRSRLLPGRDAGVSDKVLEVLSRDNIIKLDNQKVSLSSFQVQYGEDEKELIDRVERIFLEKSFSPPSLEELESTMPKDKRKLKKVLEAMLADGRLVAVAPQMYFHRKMIEESSANIAAFIGEHGQITLAEFRDLSGSSRKFSLAILEYFDRHGVTKKVGDIRVLAKR